MECSNILEVILEALKELGLRIATIVVDFVRSDDIIAFVHKVASIVNDFGIALVDFLREIIDKYVN